MVLEQAWEMVHGNFVVDPDMVYHDRLKHPSLIHANVAILFRSHQSIYTSQSKVSVVHLAIDIWDHYLDNYCFVE